MTITDVLIGYTIGVVICYFILFFISYFNNQRIDVVDTARMLSISLIWIVWLVVFVFFLISFSLEKALDVLTRRK